MRKILFVVVALLFTVLIGCGHGFVQVSGKITFEDGSPVPLGGVVFESETFMSEGRIGSDGSYTLSSLEPGDGLPPGTYKVSVSSAERGPNEGLVFYVDPKYANPETSGLTAEVTKRGKNQFDFTVTKPQKRQ